MTTPREQVMIALFSVLSAATLTDNVTHAFKTASRRIKLWTDVPSTSQPALFLIENHETRRQQNPQGMPSHLTMKATAIIYTATGSPDVIPSTQMNLCLDALDKAMLPDDPTRNIFTLGRLVYRCWIEGDIIKVPGDLDGQGMAMVPIHILLP